MDQGEGQRSEFVEDREKRGRERRRDRLTHISVQWLQGCVESQPYTQIAVKSQSHTRSGLTRPGFRDSSAARRPSSASTRVTAQVRSYPPGSSFFPNWRWNLDTFSASWWIASLSSIYLCQWWSGGWRASKSTTKKTVINNSERSVKTPERPCCLGCQASAHTKISVWTLWWEGLIIKSVLLVCEVPVTSSGWE